MVIWERAGGKKKISGPLPGNSSIECPDKLEAFFMCFNALILSTWHTMDLIHCPLGYL